MKSHKIDLNFLETIINTLGINYIKENLYINIYKDTLGQ
jgi:hypothetical protein